MFSVGPRCNKWKHTEIWQSETEEEDKTRGKCKEIKLFVINYLMVEGSQIS